jgi:hypothetical protein
MPDLLRAQIEAHRKRLLHPLHDRRELQPAGGPDIERQPPFHKSNPPKLEGKAPPRFAKNLSEDRYRLPPPEQRFTVIDRHPDLVPGILYQKSLFSHISNIYGSEMLFCFDRAEKKCKKREKAIIMRRKE